MKLQDRANNNVRRSLELKRDTDDVLMTSLRAELAIARTLCMLARQENGNERFHHVEQAKKALDMAIELARRVTPGKQERDEIEEAHREVVSLATNPSRA
jgi:imidazoleglycerol phosphate dehydratase HisB